MLTLRACSAVRNLVKVVPKHGLRNITSRAACTGLVKSYRNSLSQNTILNTLVPTLSYNYQITRNFADHADEQPLEEQTMDVLRLFDKVDPSKVSLEAHLINDLGLDSLDVVEVVMAFEDEFGIEISDTEAEQIFTVQQAVDLIKLKLDQ